MMKTRMDPPTVGPPTLRFLSLSGRLGGVSWSTRAGKRDYPVEVPLGRVCRKHAGPFFFFKCVSFQGVSSKVWQLATPYG